MQIDKRKEAYDSDRNSIFNMRTNLLSLEMDLRKKMED